MKNGCAAFRPLLDALADGEIEPSRVEPHLSGCLECKSELAGIRALKGRLARLRLPDPPRTAARPERLPARRTAWAAAAAAALALLAVLLSLASPPALFALSSEFHDDVLEGRRVLSDLGLPPSATKADYDGLCPCPPDLGAASPFVVYRTAGATVSVLAFEERGGAPDGLRRIGPNTVLSESQGSLRLIWISRLDEDELRRAVARLRPAPNLTLREFTCNACCGLLEGRGRGEGPFTMELLGAADGGPIDPARIRGLRPVPLRR